MPTATELLDRISLIRIGRPSAAELEELVDLLGSTESAEQLSDHVDPGWSGPSVVWTETVPVSEAAREALQAAGAVALVRVSARYASLPKGGRRLARELLLGAKLETWATLSAEQRAAAVEALSRAPREAAEAKDLDACLRRIRWCDQATAARASGDDAALIAAIVEGVRGGFWQSQEAVELVPAVRDVDALRRAAVAGLVARRPSAEILGGTGGMVAVLAKLGVPPNDEELAQLSAALEHAPRGDPESQLVEILWRNVDRVSPATRQRLIASDARLCASTDNEGTWRWALGRWGREALGVELEPLTRAQLASTSESTVEAALNRIELVAPAMDALVPAIAALLPSQKGRVGLLAARALAAYGPRAAPALDALLADLEHGPGPAAAAHALGAIGRDAAPALEALLEKARAARNQRLALLITDALAAISKAQPR